MNKELNLFVLIIAFTSLISCEKDGFNQQTESLIFPIGRTSFESDSYRVIINDSVYKPKIITDSNNGYWLEFSRDELKEFQLVQIQFTRKKQDLVLFSEPGNNSSKWLSSSYYIDSDNELIKEKADELTRGLTSNFEKAKRIQQFVIGHVKLNIQFKYSYFQKASTTLDLKEGTCMNFARLFVALCRAGNVPSRTIVGVIFGYEPDRNYNFGHEWAEILDDKNNWRVLDFTFTKSFDINNIKYLDLIYGPEENDFVLNHFSKEIMIASFQYYNGFPVTTTGRMGFNLVSDKIPLSLTTEYVYEYNKLHFYE